MDKICTENCIKIIQIHQKICIKIAPRKIITKKISYHFSPARPRTPKKPARPSPPRARRPHPGPGPAKCRAPSRPPGPAMARGSVAVGFDRTVARRLWPDQNQRRACAVETLGHSALPLSLSSFFLSSQPQRRQPPPSSRERGKQSGRPPRRRACSPTGEHAAVERPGRGAPLAEPSEPAPPARLLLPCRRMVHPTHPNPNAFSPF